MVLMRRDVPHNAVADQIIAWINIMCPGYARRLEQRRHVDYRKIRGWPVAVGSRAVGGIGHQPGGVAIIVADIAGDGGWGRPLVPGVCGLGALGRGRYSS